MLAPVTVAGVVVAAAEVTARAGWVTGSFGDDGSSGAPVSFWTMCRNVDGSAWTKVVAESDPYAAAGAMVVAVLLLLELDAMEEMAGQEMKEGLYNKWERERGMFFKVFIIFIFVLFFLVFFWGWFFIY